MTKPVDTQIMPKFGFAWRFFQVMLPVTILLIPRAYYELVYVGQHANDASHSYLQFSHTPTSQIMRGITCGIALIWIFIQIRRELR